MDILLVASSMQLSGEDSSMKTILKGSREGVIRGNKVIAKGMYQLKSMQTIKVPLQVM